MEGTCSVLKSWVRKHSCMRERRKSAEEFCFYPSVFPFPRRRGRIGNGWNVVAQMARMSCGCTLLRVSGSKWCMKRSWKNIIPFLMLPLLFFLPSSFSQSQILRTSMAEVHSSTGSIRSLWAHSKMWFPWSSRACRGMESYSTEKDSVETTLPWNCRKGSSPCTSTWVRVIRIIGSHITVTRIVLVCFYKSIIYIRQYLETPVEINKTCCVPQTAHSLNIS